MKRTYECDVTEGQLGKSAREMCDVDKVERLQEGYVRHHLIDGHHGYCYAWLDNGVCPQHIMCGKCPYVHSYPPSFSINQRRCHALIRRYMRWLYNDEADEPMCEKLEEFVLTCLNGDGLGISAQ